MNLNLCLLEYIVEVAKCGSISKAAQNLFVSQPHLSNQIKGMENQLNVKLASAMEILQHAPNIYMWITGLHSDTIKQYRLKLRECSDVNVTDLGYLVYASDKKYLGVQKNY